MKRNKTAQKDLSDEINLLSESIIGLSTKSVAALDKYQPTDRDEARTRMRTSSELQKRVDALIT